MKSLRHMVFNAVAAISALLFVAACFFWIRSYRVGEQWWWASGVCDQNGNYRSTNWTVVSFPSIIWFGRYQHAPYAAGALLKTGWSVKPHESGHVVQFGGERTILFLGHYTFTPSISGWASVEYAGDVVALDRLRFGATKSYRYGGHNQALVVPYWFVCLVTFPLPLAWARVKMSHRRLPGTCRVCGYDLRATRERCPECGTIADARKTQSELR